MNGTPMRWNHWAIVGAACWLVASPWILGFSEINLALWNAVLAGGAVAVLALWNFAPPEE